jgi:hypothetical protein
MRISAVLAVLTVLCAHTPEPVSVKVRQIEARGRTTYSYQVINRTGQPIVSLRIGYDASRQEPQLRTLPPHWTFERGLAPATVSSPAGWRVRLITTEENPKFMLQWDSERGGKSDIASGRSKKGFAVSLDHPSPEYREAMFEVTLRDSKRLHGTIQN